MNNEYHLNETQQRIHQYVVKELKENRKPTITEVAEKTFVSTTYIVKMAKQLGYTGYSDFLHITYWLLSNSKLEENDLIIRFDSMQKEGIRMVTNLIEKHSLNMIFLVAVGYSDLVSQFFTKKFSEIGIFCYHGSPFDMKVPHDKSLVIFISRSGETDDIVRIAKKIDESYETLLLTSSAESSLARIVNHTHVIADEFHGQVLPIPNLFLSKAIAFFEFVYLDLLETETFNSGVK